jgi:hypothetical protein
MNQNKINDTIQAYIISDQPPIPINSVSGGTPVTVVFGEWWDEVAIEFIVELENLTLGEWLEGMVISKAFVLKFHGMGFAAVFTGDSLVAIMPVGGMDRVRMFLRGIEHALKHRDAGAPAPVLRV